MEEVVGSIPTRSTNQLNHLHRLPFLDFVAFLSQIPKSLRAPALRTNLVSAARMISRPLRQRVLASAERAASFCAIASNA